MNEKLVVKAANTSGNITLNLGRVIGIFRMDIVFSRD